MGWAWERSVIRLELEESEADLKEVAGRVALVVRSSLSDQHRSCQRDEKNNADG
jgi:hypothetical protein